MKLHHIVKKTVRTAIKKNLSQTIKFQFQFLQVYVVTKVYFEKRLLR